MNTHPIFSDPLAAMLFPIMDKEQRPESNKTQVQNIQTKNNRASSPPPIISPNLMNVVYHPTIQTQITNGDISPSDSGISSENSSRTNTPISISDITGSSNTTIKKIKSGTNRAEKKQKGTKSSLPSNFKTAKGVARQSQLANMTPAQKKEELELRRERNRVSAINFRSRKKERDLALIKEIEKYEKSNHDQLKEIKILRQELANLKEQHRQIDHNN